MADKTEVEGTLYVCKVCEKRFKQESTLQLHRLIHKSEQTFSCDICKKELPFLSRLQKHYLLEHPNDILVVGKESDQSNELNVVVGLESDQSNDSLVVSQESDDLSNRNTKPFTCDICDKGFLVHDDLQKHLPCAYVKNYNGCDEEFLQNLTSTKNYMCAILCDESPSPCDRRNSVDESLCSEISTDSSEESFTAQVDPKKQFSCTFCNKRFVQQCDLENHFCIHELKPADYTPRFISDRQLSSQPSVALGVKNIGPYVCEVCDKRFVKNAYFKKHCLTHSEHNTYTCKLCDKQFARYSNFSAHCEIHKTVNSEESFKVQVDPKKQFSCTFCNQKFDQKCDLQSHFRTHEPKPADYTPRFTSDRPLSSQPSGALGVLNIGPYVCEICLKGFVKNDDFKKHCLTHSEQSTYTCKECGKQFARYSNFRAHCEIHMKKTTFNCNYCGTSFQFQKQLIGHQRMRSANAKLQCSFCDRKFDHACSLTIHEQTHRGYYCEDCGSVFTDASGLKRHQRSHVNKKWCGVCAKSFATNDTLRKHLETHFGSKSYRCKICNEEFEFKHNLLVHSCMTTDQDMPHTCQLCNEGFLHAWLLGKHLLEHEANQDAETWENRSLGTGENVENMESFGKVAINETSEGNEEKIERIIKKEKDL